MSSYIYILFNLALCNLAFFVAYYHVGGYQRRKLDGNAINGVDNNTYRILFVIFLLYSLFTFFGGDKSGYEEMVKEAGRNGFAYRLNMEDIYVWIGMIVKGNFLVWKLIVYGVSLLLCHYSLKRLGVNNLVSLLFFAGMCLMSYGATRAVLAYAVYVYGLSLIKNEKLLK